MVELKWPVDKCTHCGYDLREVTPKAIEKGNDANGKLRWGDFCPQCGKGYRVGDRVLPTPPAEVLAEREAQAILTKPSIKALEAADPEHQITAGEAPNDEASGVPPDQRGADLATEGTPDPENLMGDNEPVSDVFPAAEPEPNAIKPPGEGEYFCTKCASNHKDTDKPKSIGLRHQKYKEA